VKLLELFERDDKAPLSPEEIRLRTILSVMSSRMKKDKLPSVISYDRLGRVLDKSGVPFSADQVRSYIEKDFSDKLSMDDQGNIKSVTSTGMDDMSTDMGTDDMGALGDLGGAEIDPNMAAGQPMAAPAVEPEQPAEPVTDKNVTNQMAKRALKRRM